MTRSERVLKMSEKTIYEEWVDNDKEFERMMAQEKFILSATESICGIMNKNQITRSDLAKNLGKTKGYVTQVLSGNRNITLRTLADIIHCLGYVAHIKIEKEREASPIANFSMPWDTCQVDSLQTSDDYPDNGTTYLELEKLAS